MWRITLLLICLGLLSGLGCVIEDCDEPVYRYEVVYDYENYPPSVPRGLYSVTHDGCVELGWYDNGEPDLAYYRVYYSNTAQGPYELIATTAENQYFDYDVVNGRTYYYAVSAVDDESYESDLSPELVFDTPRPEGYNETIYSDQFKTSASAFDFSIAHVVSGNAPNADIRFGSISSSGYYYVQVTYSQIQIQDFGYTDNLDQVDYSPSYGWSQIGEVEAIAGHSYLVWTADNHFAKFRITQLNENYIVIDWAYQLDPGNQELRKSAPSTSSPVASPLESTRLNLSYLEGGIQ